MHYGVCPSSASHPGAPGSGRRAAPEALEAENTKLKKLLANSMLEIDAMREVLKGK